MIVNNLKELERELKKRVENALVTEVSDVVTDVMYQHIGLDVYDVYNPIEYDRRFDEDGLLDRNNILPVLQGDMKLSVKNITLGNKHVNLRKYYKSGGYLSTPIISKNYNKPIANVIETGQGYDVHRWEYDGVPRPFMKNTHDDLKDNHYHTIALKEGLKRQGLEVK